MRGQTAQPSSNAVERQEARRRSAHPEESNAAAVLPPCFSQRGRGLHLSTVIHFTKKNPADDRRQPEMNTEQKRLLWVALGDYWVFSHATKSATF